MKMQMFTNSRYRKHVSMILDVLSWSPTVIISEKIWVTIHTNIASFYYTFISLLYTFLTLAF